MIESLLQIAHIFLGGNVYEIEDGLNVAVEGLFVGHESLAGFAEAASQPVIAHDLAEERRDAFFTHLAELRNEIFGVALCHRSKYILDGRSLNMHTIATIVAYASGFALMRYHE